MSPKNKKTRFRDWQRAVTNGAVICLFLALLVVIYAQGSYYLELDLPLSAQRREESFDQPLPAIHDPGELFASIRLESPENLALPKAVVLINGLEAGNFANGTVSARVYSGDIVEIDTRAYGRELEFKLAGYSSNLDMSQISQTIITQDGKALLGEIKFK